MTVQPMASVAVAPPAKSRQRSLARNSAIIGLVFVSPWLIGFLLFKLVPILMALGYSFSNFHLLTPEQTRFIGLGNYLRILSDQQAGVSLFSSIGTLLFAVPMEMAVALGLALLLRPRSTGRPRRGESRGHY